MLAMTAITRKNAGLSPCAWESGIASYSVQRQPVNATRFNAQAERVLHGLAEVAVESRPDRT
jgi:hypothetical protein